MRSAVARGANPWVCVFQGNHGSVTTGGNDVPSSGGTDAEVSVEDSGKQATTHLVDAMVDPSAAG